MAQRLTRSKYKAKKEIDQPLWEAKEKIERRQFDPLPENGPEELWVERLLEDIEKRYPDLSNLKEFEAAARAGKSSRRKKADRTYREGTNVKLHLVEYASLIKPMPHYTIEFPKVTQGTVAAYQECIVRYKNTAFRNDLMRKFDAEQEQAQYIQEQETREEEARTRPSARKCGKRRRGRSASPQAESSNTNRRVRDSPHRAAEAGAPQRPLGNELRVAVIPHADFMAVSPDELIKHGTTMTSGFGNILQRIGVTQANFMDLDYLFVPFFHDNISHHVLMGISPKQGFVFIIDSCDNTYNRTDWPACGLLGLCLHLCPQGVNWPLYGKWAPRDPYDDNPNCPRQGDGVNCGVFAITNMMCLAFGYRLMCYRARDLPRKRRRMAAELGADGFGVAPFDYELLEIPTLLEYRSEYSYEPPPSPSAAPPVLEGNDRGQGDDENLPDAEEGAMVSGLPPTDRYPSTRIPVSLHPKAASTTDSNPQNGTEDLWPSQFNIKYMKKAGFVYKRPNGIVDKHIRSKRAITCACAEWGIKGYELWSREPLTIYRRWFLNEIAGGLSTNLRPIGYEEEEEEGELEADLKEMLTVSESAAKKRRDGINRCGEGCEDRECGIPEHSVGMSLRLRKQRKECLGVGCEFECGHEGPHSL